MQIKNQFNMAEGQQFIASENRKIKKREHETSLLMSLILHLVYYDCGCANSIRGLIQHSPTLNSPQI